MKKCKGCEVNNFGWCMYYNKSTNEIKQEECKKDIDWIWEQEP